LRWQAQSKNLKIRPFAIKLLRGSAYMIQSKYEQKNCTDQIHTDTSIRSEVLLDTPQLLIERSQGCNPKPVLSRSCVYKNRSMIQFNFAGAQFIRRSDSEAWNLAPPQSFVFMNGPIEIYTDVSRGYYDRITLMWDQTLTYALTKWAESHSHNNGIYISSNQFEHSSTIQDKILSMTSSKSKKNEPLIFAYIHELVATAITSKNKICLASVPIEAPGYLKQLLDNVKSSPEKPWSLTDASAIAGYSPFHLSRTFKSIMGYGFPEYVDRCRLEQAIKLFCSSNKSIDDIANSCGYHSSHSLREAMKAHLGFLPSEFKNIATHMAYIQQ